MKRPAFYFKLNSRVGLNQSLRDSGETYFFVSGHIMKRRNGMPAWLDEEVSYVSETYRHASEYKGALMTLESNAFRSCEALCAEVDAIEEMTAMHEKNLKKLNLGYMLVGWFKGMGNAVQEP